MKNVDDIVTLITYHVQTQYLSYSKISEIYDLIPDECKYSGIGFRAIAGKSQSEVRIDEESNLYWSKTQEGVSHFLHISRHEKYTLVSAQIRGVDLNKTLEWLNSLKPEKLPRNNIHSEEQEILVLDYFDFKFI